VDVAVDGVSAEGNDEEAGGVSEDDDDDEDDGGNEAAADDESGVSVGNDGVFADCRGGGIACCADGKSAVGAFCGGVIPATQSLAQMLKFVAQFCAQRLQDEVCSVTLYCW
jgi:hypothetical protein